MERRGEGKRRASTEEEHGPAQRPGELGFKARSSHAFDKCLPSLGQWMQTEEYSCLPQRGMQYKLQRLGGPSVTIFSKPRVRAVLENPGHRIAGNIQKNPGRRVMK